MAPGAPLAIGSLCREGGVVLRVPWQQGPLEGAPGFISVLPHIMHQVSHPPKAGATLVLRWALPRPTQLCLPWSGAGAAHDACPGARCQPHQPERSLEGTVPVSRVGGLVHLDLQPHEGLHGHRGQLFREVEMVHRACQGREGCP